MEVVTNYWKAEKTWDEAWKTWEEARETYREAWKTYGEALQSSFPHPITLIKELVPDTAWNGEELVFT